MPLDVLRNAPVRMVAASTAASPDEAMTSGSLWVQESGTALRHACAEARAIYLNAAAAKWHETEPLRDEQALTSRLNTQQTERNIVAIKTAVATRPVARTISASYSRPNLADPRARAVIERAARGLLLTSERIRAAIA